MYREYIVNPQYIGGLKWKPWILAKNDDVIYEQPLIINIVVVVLFINVVVISKTNEYLTMTPKVSKELKITFYDPTDVSHKFPSASFLPLLIKIIWPNKYFHRNFLLLLSFPLCSWSCLWKSLTVKTLCLGSLASASFTWAVLLVNSFWVKEQGH